MENRVNYASERLSLVGVPKKRIHDNLRQFAKEMGRYIPTAEESKYLTKSLNNWKRKAKSHFDLSIESDAQEFQRILLLVYILLCSDQFFRKIILI